MTGQVGRHILLIARLAVALLCLSILMAACSTATSKSALLKSVDWDKVRYPVGCYGYEAKPIQIVYTANFSGDMMTLVMVQCDAQDGAGPVGIVTFDSASATNSPHLLQVVLNTSDNWVASGKMSLKSSTLTLAVGGYSSNEVPRCCSDVGAELTWVWNGSVFHEESSEPAHARLS